MNSFKVKNLKKFFVVLIMLLLMGKLPIYAAEATPKISFVGIGHSPLVVGEKEDFIFASHQYEGLVQYRVWLNKIGTEQWQDISKGYTEAVQASTPYTFHYDKPFQLGKYKLSVWVKRADSSIKYDHYYTAYLNCVNKDDNNRVYTEGALQISAQEAAVGEKVTISGIDNIRGMKGPYKYKLHLFNPGKVTEKENGWTKNVTEYKDRIEWTPEEPGIYVVDVWTTSSNSKVRYEGWKLHTIKVGTVSSEQAVKGAMEYIKNINKPTDWDIIALNIAAKSNSEIDIKETNEKYLQNKAASVKEHFTEYSSMEDASTLLALIATGQNYIDFQGVNFGQEVRENLEKKEAYLGNTVWSMISLETVGEIYNREAALKYLESRQNADGGYSFYPEGKSDIGLTSMVLCATWMAGVDKQATTYVKGMQFLQSQLKQMEKNPAGENAELLAEAIIGITTSGEEPSQYNLSGRNLIEELLTFRGEDGGFRYKRDFTSNPVTTYKALLALEFYRMKKFML